MALLRRGGVNVFAAAAMLKLLRGNDGVHKTGESIFVVRRLGDDLLDLRFIGRHDRPAEREAEQLPGKVAYKLRLVIPQVIAKAADAAEFNAAQLGEIVDRNAPWILGADAANGVEAFQRETEGIESSVTDRTARLFAVRLQTLNGP